MTTAAGEPSQDAAVASWVIPAIIGSTQMMLTLSANVVVTALPAMAKSLHVDLLHMNLAVTMFMLSATVFIPVSSWLADRFGARRVLMATAVLFAMSSAVCGFAQGLTELIAARMVQGVAAAIVLPLGRLVLLRSTPKHEIVGAMSVLVIPALLGPVIGPVLGGAIVTFADWRWIFFMNLPIALVGVILIRAYVPDVPPEKEVAPLDWVGLGLTTVVLSGLVFGMEAVGRDLVPPYVVAGMFGVSALFLFAYWRHARGRVNAIIDVSLFRIRTFSTSVLGGSFLRIGMGASPFLLTMLLQVCFGMTAFAAGMMTFMSAAGGLFMKQAGPPILRQFGFRTVLIVNGLIVGTSFSALAFFRPTTPHWLIMVVLAGAGFLRSLQFTSFNGLAYAELEQEQLSRASAVVAIFQQLGQSIGISLAAAILQMWMLARGQSVLTTDVVWPSFIVFGVLTMVSLFWCVGLPQNAGHDLHDPARSRSGQLKT